MSKKCSNNLSKLNNCLTNSHYENIYEMSTNCLPFIQIKYKQSPINIDDRGKKLPCLAGKLKHYKTGQLLYIIFFFGFVLAEDLCITSAWALLKD